MIAPHEALDMILSRVNVLPSEKVYFLNALGRICAEDVISIVDVPNHRNSAMDGYAIVAADTTTASRENPTVLNIVGQYQAGVIQNPVPIQSGQAVRIMTGSVIPPGADAVVEKEATLEDGNCVHVFRKVQPGENIREAGEDIKRGECVVAKGTRITPAVVGLLASVNALTVTVAQQPRVAVITTGDEIEEPGTSLKEGVVINANAYTLSSLVREYGGIPHYFGIIPDTPQATIEAITRAMSCDVIVSSGGVSEGMFDCVIDALRELGFTIFIERIAMKPGKPCVCAQKGNTLYFGLPGNPVSSMVSFLEFVRPAILAMQGANRLQKPILRAICKEPIRRKRDGRTHYIRGILTFEDGNAAVRLTGPQGSGILRSMALANCLIVLPPDVDNVEPGDSVFVQLIDHIEV